MIETFKVWNYLSYVLYVFMFQARTKVLENKIETLSVLK